MTRNKTLTCPKPDCDGTLYVLDDITVWSRVFEQPDGTLKRGGNLRIVPVRQQMGETIRMGDDLVCDTCFDGCQAYEALSKKEA